MSRRPLGHGDLRNMGNFKAVAIDYEFYLTLSDKPQSVCLTERQMYVLSVQNTYTAWLSRWYHVDDITQKTVELIAAEIEGLLVMCNCGVPALTPTDTFNTMNYVNDTTTIYNDTQNTWNTGGQTVVSIAPNLDYDTGDPVDISKMICAAMELLIRSILAEGKAINEQSAEQNKNLLNVISSAMSGLATAGGIAALIEGFAAGALGFLAGPWLLLGLALGAIGVKVATLFMGADNSLFENEEAIAHVICAAQNNIVDQQVTREVFAAALTPLGYGDETPEGKIAAMIRPFLDDLDTYLQFMVAGNGLYSKVVFAEMPDCGCPPPPATFVLNDMYSPGQWMDGMANVATYVGIDGDGHEIWDCPCKVTIDTNVQSAFGSTPYCHVYSLTMIDAPAGTLSYIDAVTGGPVFTSFVGQNVRSFYYYHTGTVTGVMRVTIGAVV